jgi:hypothetical protein
MAFGLLMRDNTPVRLGGRGDPRLGYVPAGPYFPGAPGRATPQTIVWGNRPMPLPGTRAQAFPRYGAMTYSPGARTFQTSQDWSITGGEMGLAAKALVKLGYLRSTNATRQQVVQAFTRYALSRGFTQWKFGTNWDDYAFESLVKQAGFAGYGHMHLPGTPYGWVDATGGGDDPAPTPGTAPVQEQSSWDKLATSFLNLGTSVAGAIAGAIQPQSGAAGSYCPSGYYLNNGRCVPVPQQQSSMSTGLLLGAAAIGAVLLLKK